jgi:hypothetical protein
MGNASRFNESIDKIANELAQLENCPKEVCDFFASTKKKRFFSSELGFPSYFTIQGRDHVDVPDGYPLDKKIFPVQNRDSDFTEEAIEAAEKLGRSMITHDPKDAVRIDSRDYMVEGSSLPIRINYTINPHNGKRKSKKEVLYVKQMNLNRVFAAHLYTLATGRPIGVVFSEGGVFEPEVKGRLLVDFKPKDILEDPNLRRELLRLDIAAHFIGLNDIDNCYNILLTPQGRLAVFDFDKLLFSQYEDPHDRIVNPFVVKSYDFDQKSQDVVTIMNDFPDDRFMKYFKRDNVDAIIREERHQIYHRLKRNFDEFVDLVHLMGHIPYYVSGVQNLFGQRNPATHYLSAFADLRRG